MSLKHTPLDALHRELGARMVPFAGYDMPVQYAAGIIAEHRHTRSKAGLFDVSHMGQFLLEGPGIAQTLESLVPADLVALGEHRQCYSLLTNDHGGVRDDLIITRVVGEQFFLVVNAACKDDDRSHIEVALNSDQRLLELKNQGLLALQGPAARAVLAQVLPGVADLLFLQGAQSTFEGLPVYVTCSGYTGEDGFEISVAAEKAEALAQRLLAHADVAPVGLGARDSLRLEAGLCLYGHDLSVNTSPVEAGLAWAIARARRPGGARPGAYPGATTIARNLAEGCARRRVGLRVDGRRPVREGQAVIAGDGSVVGEVTSGGFGPTVDAPIAMAYVQSECAALDTELSVDARGKLIPVRVAKMPFVAPNYFRG
jgi:aminomethyltransferase